MEIKLPQSVEYIIEKIEACGFKADVVGGPVRDFLLGNTPFDYDITTSATPQKIKEIFSDERTLDIGLKHGTVTLMLGGDSYEITTYRVDGEYLDSRHPENVEFTSSLEEDLARRDFTMNAVSYNPERGFCDPFSGKEDIKNRLIRAVGEAERRFEEDALRIMRGARFAATLGFSVEEKTREAMSATSHLLANIARERIYTEWKKLLSGRFAYSALSEFSDIIKRFLPELDFSALPNERAFSEADFYTRQMSFFYLSCGSESALRFETAMRRLKTDRVTRESGALILSSVGKYDNKTPFGRRIMLASLGDKELAVGLLRLEGLLGITDAECERALLDELLDGVAYRISDLKVDGKDISALGYRGEKIGKTLKALLFAVAASEVENDREKLLSFVAQIG